MTFSVRNIVDLYHRRLIDYNKAVTELMRWHALSYNAAVKLLA